MLKDNHPHILILSANTSNREFSVLSTYFATYTNKFSNEKLSSILDDNQAHLAIIDIVNIDQKSLYCLRWLKNYHPHLPILVILEMASSEDRIKMLKLGIQTYILKPFLSEELLIMVNNLLDNRQGQCKYQKIDFGDLVFDTYTNSILKDKEKTIHLTTLEADILKLLCLNSGSVLSRDDIMLQIRGVKHNPLDRSIDIHINNLRRKIETTPSSPKYIRTIRGKGYQLCMLN